MEGWGAYNGNWSRNKHYILDSTNAPTVMKKGYYLLTIENEWRTEANNYPVIKELTVGLAAPYPVNMMPLTKEEGLEWLSYI